MRFRLALAFIALVQADPSIAQPSPGIAFDNVRIRTMDADRIVGDGYVIVRDGRIAEMGQGDLPATFDGQRIEGNGATLMPGLADMHVHHYETDLGAAYLANGITLVRNLTGSLGAARRDQAALDGTVVGPRVETSGPIIDGGEGFPNDLFVRARTPGEAVGAVRSQAQSGFRAVKLYEELDAATYRAAVAEARANGMRVYSHVPDSLDVFALLDLKIDSIEHLDGYAQAMARAGFTTKRDNAWAEWWANVDRGKFAELARRTAVAGSWAVPTFAITYGRIRSADPDAYFARPEARLLPLWAESWRQTARGYEADRPFLQRSLTEKAAFVRALKKAGANILIGTDAPNPFVTPGYAIHDELAAFALAGFTNEEILRLAIVEPARFLGEAGRAGVVAPGARADLVLLASDPAKDLSVLRRPLGVMVAGHWHSRAAIDAALDRRRVRMDASRVRR